MKKIKLLIFVTLLIPSISFADTFTFNWIDSTGVPGNEYTLVINGSAGTYTGDLKVETLDTSPKIWYINWIQIHLDGGKNPDVTSLTTKPSIDWYYADKVDNPAVNVLQIGGNIPVDGYIAFYTDGIKQTNGIITQGALLDGSNYQWVFDFTLASGTQLNMYPSLKVGYYSDTNPEFAQMSQQYAIPEPATMLLLGSGLIGLAGVARRRFRK